MQTNHGHLAMTTPNRASPHFYTTLWCIGHYGSDSSARIQRTALGICPTGLCVCNQWDFHHQVSPELFFFYKIKAFLAAKGRARSGWLFSEAQVQHCIGHRELVMQFLGWLWLLCFHSTALYHARSELPLGTLAPATKASIGESRRSLTKCLHG